MNKCEKRKRLQFSYF